jgi:outer membrane protein OmpA-like peptidoglycan-associated protein
MPMSPRIAVAGLVTLLLAVAGCSSAKKDGPATPAPSASAALGSAALGGASSAPAAGLETRTFTVRRGDKLTMTMTPLIRSGDKVVLTVPTRLDAAANNLPSSLLTVNFSRTLGVTFDGPRLIDEAAGRVYEVAAGASCVCTGAALAKSGETVPLQAAYAGVPADVTKLTVQLPHAGVFLDVPVQDGTVPAPPATTQGGSPLAPLDLTAPATSVAGDLTALIDRHDTGVLTTRTPKQVDISLAADVLFRLDQATLTPAAARSVAAAVAELQAAGAGPLTVTGHTDSTGTDAHNQTLSEARAQTVARALTARLPDAQWPKTVSGKGEKQPIADNGTAGGRRLNRRVTISYQTRTAAPGSTPPSAATTEAPRTKGVIGTAPDGVQVVLPSHATIRITPGSVTRRGGYLLVTLVAHNVGTQSATFFDYLNAGFWHRQGLDLSHNPYDDSGVRLLDGATAGYPLDYEIEKYTHGCLCDPDLADEIAPGAERQLPLWFPAPPPGTSTITVDVPDKFRITGIPIS